MSKEIAYYEDGIPVSQDGHYIFPRAQDLPKTHFPVPDEILQQSWILVRNGQELPRVGQQIMFIKDVRGTQDESTYNLLGREFPAQRVMHGFVTEIGYSEELGDHWISACSAFMPDGGPIGEVSADHITYWMPMPVPPEDTFKRSPYSYYHVFEIVQKASIEIEKNKQPTGEEDESQASSL
jgi:hypothetical protein